MTQTGSMLLGSTSLSSDAIAVTAATTRQKAPPKGYAYDYFTGQRIVSQIELHNPQGGGDAELTRQWHLKQLGDIGAVWRDFTGKGVSVGVYDSGVQKEHWDLAANYDASKHLTINGKVLDGGPIDSATDTAAPHRTSVAGLIAAARNGRGGVGIAYDAKVTGINIFDANSPAFGNGQDKSGFMEALRQSNSFDVTNHSYGPGWSQLFGRIGTAIDRQVDGNYHNLFASNLAYVSETGRDGLGTVSVSAAGNEAMDGLVFAASTTRHAVTVSAFRQVDGARSSYSNFGPHILVSAPSNDRSAVGGTGQVTTDLLGDRGYNLSADPSAPNDYTDRFGGTSGAAPVVAGVVTLMLDANENLGWRDVREILAASAKMPVAFETGPVVLLNDSPTGLVLTRLNGSRFKLAGDDAKWNGGAMHYSNDYGYGAVDAYNAVRMAEVWGLFGAAKTSANEVRATVSTDVGLTAVATDKQEDPDSSIKYHDTFLNAPTEFKFEMTDNVDIENVDLQINFDQFGTTLGVKNQHTLHHTQFKLIAPDGTEAFLSPLEQSLFNYAFGSETMTFGFSGMQGVQSAGTWTLQWSPVNIYLPDGSIGRYSSVRINSLKMDVYGAAPSDDDVYTYTNEFFDMLAIKGEGGRRTLVDTDSGTDWINAAAVSSDVKLSLVGGQSTSFGGERAFTIGRTSVIEGAVTGDGNDTLIGNRFDNYLYGMRGNDTLNGGAGNDVLFGGTGDDRFLFDNRGTSGKDTVLDWSRGDMIATQTALRGQAGNGTVTVAKNAMLLLDGLLTGDTVLLSQNGGAVLQAQGQKDGYFWYSYLSGADLDPNEVIREVSFQPERTAAGAVAALAATADAGLAADAGALGLTTSGPVGGADVFYLYDAMAASMGNGVMLHA